MKPSLSRHTSNGYNPNRRMTINHNPYNNIIPSTATLRQLVHVMVAGGVIGHKGSLVRNMEAQIGVRIRLAGAVHGYVERVVSVSGSDVVSRKVMLEDEDENEVCDVSPVQEAMLRVFERAMEVDAEKGGEEGEGLSSCCCRLLADRMDCGILIGKGGKRVAKICRDSRANVRVLRSEQNPAFLSPDDRIIHITGGLLPVKRALLAVSNVLQGLSQTENGPVLMNMPPMVTVPTMINVNAPVVTVHRQELPDLHVEFFPDLCVPIDAAKGGSSKEVGSVNVFRSVDQGDEQCDVIFRMVCSNKEAGAIIGKGASVVRLLQNESGAFIEFTPPVEGAEYRILTISAKEGSGSSYSPAQNAVVRIVARLAEIGAKESCALEAIVVRLVIKSAQADSFRGEDSILLEIEDVGILISEGDTKLSILPTDEILQVTGEYKEVQIALLQITRKLRDDCFPSLVIKAGEINHPSFAIPDIDCSKRVKSSNFPQSSHKFHILNQGSMTKVMNHLRISNRSNGCLPRQKDMGKGSMSSDDLESTKSSDKEVTLEVKVPDHVFDSVFGENGSNINHIQQISAADVKVQDPTPGQTECRVTVSGKPTQVLAASTLLQAYIQAASLSSSSGQKLGE